MQPPKLLVGCAGGLPTAGSAANLDHFGARHAEIYNPANAVGQRWSGLLADSQVDRLAHSTAFLTMNGEVRTAGPAHGLLWRPCLCWVVRHSGSAEQPLQVSC